MYSPKFMSYIINYEEETEKEKKEEVTKNSFQEFLNALHSVVIKTKKVQN